ncbi:hypothetical protein CK203_099374 [Vitis vinifera]|uniref:Uncharacterized protein n=1 Tax=Vitis vinifera TaxID=29760 RepID=A0A438CHU8_VITVI|nr:hypothetical protein CK203_099374 [Vitis vinifera]
MRKSSSLSHIKLNKTNGPESISHTPSAPCESLHSLAMSKLPSVSLHWMPRDHPLKTGPTPPKPLTPFLTWRALEEAILTLHCLASRGQEPSLHGIRHLKPSRPRPFQLLRVEWPSNPPQR